MHFNHFHYHCQFHHLYYYYYYHYHYLSNPVKRNNWGKKIKNGKLKRN